MTKIIKSFIVGFLTGLVIYLAFLSYVDPYDERSCFDCYKEGGFPFVSHRWGKIEHLDETVWTGLVGNILVLILFCVLVGMVSHFVVKKNCLM